MARSKTPQASARGKPPAARAKSPGGASGKSKGSGSCGGGAPFGAPNGPGKGGGREWGNLIAGVGGAIHLYGVEESPQGWRRFLDEPDLPCPVWLSTTFLLHLRPMIGETWFRVLLPDLPLYLFGSLFLLSLLSAAFVVYTVIFVVESLGLHLPRGSYMGSCQGCVLRDDFKVLSCKACNDSSGVSHASVLSIDKCRKDEWIVSKNGVLSCETDPRISITSDIILPILVTIFRLLKFLVSSVRNILASLRF